MLFVTRQVERGVQDSMPVYSKHGQILQRDTWSSSHDVCCNVLCVTYRLDRVVGGTISVGWTDLMEISLTSHLRNVAT